MEFVNIDGREVPTSTYLKKIGIMKPGGGMPDLIKDLKDDDNTLTADNVRCIVWNIQRCSSFTYINRYIELLVLFEKAYEKFINRSTNVIDNYEISSLKSLNEAIDTAQKGFDQLKSGNKYGYRQIVTFDLDFRRWFTHTPMHYTPDFSELGYDGLGTITGPFRMISAASEMSMCIFPTAYGTNKIPDNFNPPHNLDKAPQSANFIKSSNDKRYKTGDIVPVSGIWNPYSFKSGCPNYLIEGTPFREVQIAVKKYYRPEFWSEKTKSLNEATQCFDYESFPTDWQLLWEDTRYKDGKIPEEEALYLDESIAIPEEYR